MRNATKDWLKVAAEATRGTADTLRILAGKENGAAALSLQIAASELSATAGKMEKMLADNRSAVAKSKQPNARP